MREGRSCSPDEFAIALEHVVAWTDPIDYCDPDQFFSRTCVSRALKERAGVVFPCLAGTVPPEVWNRLGVKVLPTLRSGKDRSVGIEFSVSVGLQSAQDVETELKQILHDLGLGDRVRVERL